jgi:hypothetical protein
MYTNSEQIVTFLNKAQNKIADLATLVASRGSDKDSLSLLLELKNIVKVLDSEFLDWTEEEIQSVVDYYNMVGNLNAIPFMSIPGLNVSVTSFASKGGSSASINSVYDIPDFAVASNAQIAQASHDNFVGVLGGAKDEMYHIDKKMYDWLKLQVYPVVVPTVSLSLTATTPALVNSVAEKGTTITQVKVTPTITLGSATAITSGVYTKNGADFATITAGNATSTWTLNEAITETQEFKYRVSFEGATPVLSAGVKVPFELPHFWTTKAKSVAVTTSNMTKVLRAKPSQVNITFTAPDLNPMAADPLLFSVALPVSWGVLKNIYADNNAMFDYITSFDRTTIEHTLADGTKENYYLYKIKDAAGGTFNANFKY